MFSREDGTISVELVIKAIQENLKATDHMTLSSLFVEKVIKAAENLFQINILIVSRAYGFYPSCNPVISKCIILGIFNQSMSKFYGMKSGKSKKNKIILKSLYEKWKFSI